MFMGQAGPLTFGGWGKVMKPDEAAAVLAKDLENVMLKAKQGKTLTARERALVQSAAAGTVDGESSAFAKTYDELAQRLGVSRKTIQNVSKKHREDVPKARPDGRHDVGAWSAFMIKHNIARAAEGVAGGAPSDAEESNAPVTVTDWKAEELKLKCEKLQIENAKVAGELVVAAEMEAGTSTLVTAFRQALNNFGPRLAQKVLNISDYHEAEEVIQEEINVVLRTLQRCEFLEQFGGDTLETASPVVAVPAQAEMVRPEQKPQPDDWLKDHPLVEIRVGAGKAAKRARVWAKGTGASGRGTGTGRAGVPTVPKPGGKGKLGKGKRAVKKAVKAGASKKAGTSGQECPRSSHKKGGKA
jgi:hypothetical protein